MVQVVTGDSQEEVIIFRDRQTHHHNIYIVITITITTQVQAAWQDQQPRLIDANHHQRRLSNLLLQSKVSNFSILSTHNLKKITRSAIVA